MMANSLVKLIKLNNLQYNPNRDPQVYRRTVKAPFRIQALLDGEGEARCALRDEKGGALAEAVVKLPGTFTHELSFATPGVRLVTLTVEQSSQKFSQDLRLDVLERAWVG